MDKDYYAGVIEGFYGQPWTQKQRLNLLPQMAEWGLNTYFYGPKDDLKHRAIWRQSYDEQELSQLRELIAACNEHGIRFIYGLSPGLDIQFSDTDELDIVKARLGQLIDVGAHVSSGCGTIRIRCGSSVLRYQLCIRMVARTVRRQRFVLLPDSVLRSHGSQ